MNNFYSLINISIVTFLLTVPLSAQGTTEVTIHSYDFTNGLEGWTTVNDSEPQANAHGFSAQAWGIRSTYDSGSPVISNWVISPVIQLQAGDVIEFRIGGNNLAELRLSTSGAATADPTPNNGNATDLGDFTTLLFTADPDNNFSSSGWNLFTVEIPAADIPDGVTDFKLAMRHFNNSNGGGFLDVQFLNIKRQTPTLPVASYDFTNDLKGWTNVNDSEPQDGVIGFSVHPDVDDAVTSTYDSGSPVISDWIISPVIQLQAGYIIEFQIAGGASWMSFAELRLSTKGETTAEPTPNNGNATDLGDFTTLLFTGNPDINFPNDNIWHDYAIEIPAAAIPDGVTDFKIAIRHFNNTNQGNFLNLDFVNILRRNTLSTPDFNTSQHLQVYPQPALDRISLKTEYKGALHLDFFDLSGRKVKSYKNTLQRDFNVSDLRKSGRMFLVQIESASGSLIAHKKLLLR